MLNLELYWSFMKIGGLTFGGGLTMLPMLKYELVEQKKWIEENELLDCYAIGQCTPGIIAVNTATYVGYKKNGLAGGICATLGMITPSLVIITVIAACLRNFMDYAVVQHALGGIKAVVCALMLNTVITLARKSLVSAACFMIAGMTLVCALFTEIPTIVLVLAAGVAGILVKREEQ